MDSQLGSSSHVDHCGDYRMRGDLDCTDVQFVVVVASFRIAIFYRGRATRVVHVA